MEENLNDIKYSAVVPYNNPVMVAARKKQRTLYGILILVCALFFGLFTIMSATSNNASMGVVAVFAIFTAVCIGLGIYYFCTTKASGKNDNKSILYTFHNDYLEVHQDDKDKNTHKTLSTCLYRSAQNKQYVAQVMECSDMFEIKIYTGTYNMMPQYKKYVVPKESINGEELEAFIGFLKQKLGSDYFVKKQK